jgi:hypothetical protein
MVNMKVRPTTVFARILLTTDGTSVALSCKSLTILS